MGSATLRYAYSWAPHFSPLAPPRTHTQKHFKTVYPEARLLACCRELMGGSGWRQPRHHRRRGSSRPGPGSESAAETSGAARARRPTLPVVVAEAGVAPDTDDPLEDAPDGAVDAVNRANAGAEK